jgi:hypothetical protein
VVALVLVYRDMIGLPVLETFHDSYGLHGDDSYPTEVLQRVRWHRAIGAVPCVSPRLGDA